MWFLNLLLFNVLFILCPWIEYIVQYVLFSKIYLNLQIFHILYRHNWWPMLRSIASQRNIGNWNHCIHREQTVRNAKEISSPWSCVVATYGTITPLLFLLKLYSFTIFISAVITSCNSTINQNKVNVGKVCCGVWLNCLVWETEELLLKDYYWHKDINISKTVRLSLVSQLRTLLIVSLFIIACDFHWFVQWHVAV